ncbi:hypothetical protein B566_EDAN006942 [Ephemera danica]|nr:hypothetical protein B566_EDAN006940 [Ephemera danica]KAF4521353.1 hypothetical protein B566_EDAN006942 [Ephemera danica]
MTFHYFRLQFSISMEQGNKGDDVYEFKSSKDATPVTGSPETDGNKSTGGGKEAEVRELSSTSAGGRVGAPSSPTNKEERGKDAETGKRGASEMDGVEEADEENRRKKRKEEKSDSKESSRNVSGSGRSTGRNGAEKSSKSSTVGSKNGNGKTSAGGSSVSGAASLGDRKSPSNSGSAGNSPKAPSFKPSSAQGDSESDGDDGKKDAVSGSGPKVPPLKIVIPQQSSTEQEQGTRNGKNGNGRHQALPYVVTSSNDSEQGITAEKQEAGAGYSGLGKDEKKDAASLQEERSQRVLRSSHRSSNHGGGSGGAGMAVGGSSSSLPLDSMANSPSPSKSDDKQETSEVATVSVHPRKRKIKTNKETSVESSSNPPSSHTDVHPHDQPITNCYEMFLNIRRQIEKRRRGLFPVQPKPPQGFKDYLMNQCNYILASNIAEKKVNMLKPPAFLLPALKELFIEQDKERYKLCVQHVVEKEKLVLSVEQEILRVHGRAARALANQSLPFSVCTMLKDEEVYNVITPEQEEKDRNARSRYNGRLFLSWLQDVDDKWEKIKENMVSRHHNEAYALHAVQKMNWEWKLKELALCDFNENPKIDSSLVPFIHVSDDFDLLPA